MSDDPAARLARDIDAIAADIPHETSGFAELRNLLGLLPNPLGPLIPGSAATQLGDPAETMGGGSLQSPVSDVVGSGAQPGSQPGWDQALGSQAVADAFANTGVGPKGFGSSVQRYLVSGIYNGDFALPPRDTAAALLDANPLPFWRFVQVSGQSWSAKSTVDPTTGSGRTVVFSMLPGAAGDEAYIEQIIPISASLTRQNYYAFAVSANNVGLATASIWYNNIQYLKADGVTATGALTESTVAALGLVDNVVAPLANVPADAYYVRIRFGVRRNGSPVGNIETITLVETRLNMGSERQWLPDIVTPALNPASLSKNTGRVILNYDPFVASQPGLTIYGAGYAPAPAPMLNIDAAYLGMAIYDTVLALGGATSVADGAMLWDRLFESLRVGDSVRLKPVTAAGFQNYAWASGLPQIAAGGIVLTLPINGGSIAIPIPVIAPMIVRQYVFRQTDVAGLHGIECRLYLDVKNNSATATEVAGGNATAAYTPGAAGSQGLVLAAPLTLAPGLYFLVIRNTSGAVTVGIQATAGQNPGVKGHAVKTLAAVLPATLDLVTGWASAATIPELVMTGSILGEGAGGVWS